MLSGCSTVAYRLFHPVGPVASIEWRFTLIDFGVMLLIILPITLMIIVFMWRYRKSRNADYDPNWSHSLGLELLMWGVPFIVVLFLGYYSYQSVLLVNPYNPTALEMTNPAEAPLHARFRARRRPERRFLRRVSLEVPAVARRPRRYFTERRVRLPSESRRLK